MYCNFEYFWLFEIYIVTYMFSYNIATTKTFGLVVYIIIQQASMFLADYSSMQTTPTQKESGEAKSQSDVSDLFHFLHSSIQNSLGVTSKQDDPLPMPFSLARALLLSLHRECTSSVRYSHHITMVTL